MLIIKRIKAFFYCFSIYQIELLWKFSGLFIIIILIFVFQIFGIVEIIPTVCAITSIEDSLDTPIPLEDIEDEEALSIEINEPDLYEEIPDHIVSVQETPTLLPGWANKEAAKTSGLLIGVLIGLATRTYLLIISPNSGFSCNAYHHRAMQLREFLRNFY